MNNSRSKGETNRLRKLANADYRRVEREDDLPSIGSHSGDESEWSSALGDGVDFADEGPNATPSLADSDEEQLYELQPRNQTVTKAVHDTKRKVIPRLPIKLANGQIEKTGEREGTVEAPSISDTSGAEEEQGRAPPPPRNDVATGARFGRPAVVDILTMKSRKLRVQAAKEQVAGICQDIIAEPENGVSKAPPLTPCQLSLSPAARSSSPYPYLCISLSHDYGQLRELHNLVK